MTQAQWTAKMGNNPSFFVPANGYASDTAKPVEQVSWNMIADTGGFMSLTGLRLPTEAEWEFACRAGTTTARYGAVNNISWYNDNAGGITHAIASKLPNALGLYDTLGNVWEWCQDRYSDTYYASSPLTNPTGPSTGDYRLFRGGSWLNVVHDCRASRRVNITPDFDYRHVGFRVARNP